MAIQAKGAMDFSIVIPAKNEEANIRRCLESIARVDWDPGRYEVIVVDNGSTDRTVEIAREKGVRVLSQPELTISGLRNHGARQSSGEIIAFLDADCAVQQQWLSAASCYLGGDGDVVAFGSPVVVPEGATWVQQAWFNVRGKPGLVTDVEWLESANLFITRSAFFAVNGFDESLITCEDYDLTQRLKALGRLVSDYRVMAVHYREPATVREFVRKEMWRGKNSYTGLLKRKIDRSEIPSLIFPLVALCFGFCLLLLLAAFALSLNQTYLFLLVLLVAVWQLPVLLVSTRKNRSGRLATVFQLVVLFNVYFLARGLVVLRKG